MLCGVVFLPHPPILVPQVGKGSESEAAVTQNGVERVVAYAKSCRPDIVVCISPHGETTNDRLRVYMGARFTYNFGRFGAKEAVLGLQVAQDFSGELLFEIGENLSAVACATSEDHGAAVPLYFLAAELAADTRYVLATPGGLSERSLPAVGKALRRLCNRYNGRVLVLASGDLSHYLKADGPYGIRQEGKRHDEAVVAAFKRNVSEYFSIGPEVFAGAGQCAYEPFAIALHAAGGDNLPAQVYSYEGPFGVGYMTAALAVNEHSEEDSPPLDSYCTLARLAAYYAVYAGMCAKPEYFEKWDAVPKQYQAAAFVTLERNGALRGCIGTMQPTKSNVAEEICSAAHQAALSDPRFVPVDVLELGELSVKTDVLGKIEDIDFKNQLDVKRYGVIVSAGTHRGLLLPNLENVDSVEQQIEIALAKAGIQGGYSGYKLQRFEVVRHTAFL